MPDILHRVGIEAPATRVYEAFATPSLAERTAVLR